MIGPLPVWQAVDPPIDPMSWPANGPGVVFMSGS